MENFEQRRLLSALSHGAIFFSSTIVSIGIPIAIFLINEDPVVKENARESLNFHINLYIYAVIFGLLVFVGIGIVLLIVLWVVSLIMPIIAIIRVLKEPNVPYRYPLIFRFL
ncbi:DUF4870 domain-containing protein [Nostoc sp. CENA67]|uniref:DUF4870 domain-containing protein n=1 Tax=Amazonocrinis nigriterrae CENA67 TaxID=2794033 RepID=A0A8J7I0W4_9NOST|nr:DUF4870 domain-containing protein [Amazonocrinis nigriterrae]MBH8565989.1 DUF4870 domain-containing protein [Amazonocrinis nigriterrae CENA67]